MIFLKRLGRSTIGAIIKAAVALLPPRVRVILMAEAPIIRRMDYSKRDIWLHVDSEFEYRIRLRSCSREPDTVQWIESYFRDGDVFYDIGANVGAYTLVAAKFFDGRVKVIAFEPSTLNFGQLVRNVELNACVASVTPLQVALADATRLEVFNYRSLAPGGALHALGAPIDERGRNFEPVMQHPLLAYGLDDLIDRFGLPAPSHIKMDVDGGERRILAGAPQTLDSPSLRSVLVEAGPGDGTAAALTAMLVDRGFKLKATSPLEAGAVNLLFTRTAA